MCKFLSVVTAGDGKPYFFDAKIRLELKKSDPRNYKYDSHTSIAHYFGLVEDRLNKYEYCPITKTFIVDQINNKGDDREQIENWYKKFIETNQFAEIIEAGLFDLDLSSLTSLPEGVKFPEKVETLDLRSLTSLPEGVKFPENIKYLDLRSLNKKQLNMLPQKLKNKLY